MQAVSQEVCYLVGAQGPTGMRYLAGPLALVSEPAAALKFVSDELARRSLPAAVALAGDLPWRVLRAEVQIRHDAA